MSRYVYPERVNPATSEYVPCPTFGAVDVTDWTPEEINDDFYWSDYEHDAWMSSTVPAPAMVGLR